jgi:hypothetical protein
MRGVSGEPARIDLISEPKVFRVPQGNAEHAAQANERAFAPFLVGVHDRLGVAGGVEVMPARLQLVPQLGVVVDLSVENDPDALVFVVDWLVAGREVDDRQPAHAQRDAVLHEHTLIIRTAMPDCRAHRGHCLPRFGL